MVRVVNWLLDMRTVPNCWTQFSIKFCRIPCAEFETERPGRLRMAALGVYVLPFVRVVDSV
jgi:hypothetical protein